MRPNQSRCANDLGTLPGASYSIAYAINNSGQVVGESGQRATEWVNGSIINLGWAARFHV